MERKCRYCVLVMTTLETLSVEKTIGVRVNT